MEHPSLPGEKEWVRTHRSPDYIPVGKVTTVRGQIPGVRSLSWHLGQLQGSLSSWPVPRHWLCPFRNSLSQDWSRVW